MPPYLMCDRCRRGMRCVRNGLVMSINEDYDLMKYDLWECPSCLRRVRARFGEPYPNPTRIKADAVTTVIDAR